MKDEERMDGWIRIFVSRYTFTRTINVNENREDRGREGKTLTHFWKQRYYNSCGRTKEGERFVNINWEGNKKIISRQIGIEG